MKSFDLVVASHLRWNSVWQRPQQILSRLAKYHRILLIEEPVFASEDAGNPSLTLNEVLPNITVLTPHVSVAACGDTPLWLWPCRETISRQVRQALSQKEFTARALWLYTPTPDFLVETVRPEMLVVDVMDELANFKFAPPQLKENETRLLAQAAVVFTGGASMFEAKKHLNPNTHLFASGVDSRHYASACQSDTQLPDWLAALPAPRATYIGVIDERLDYALLAHVVQAHPNLQFVMCGPVVKVNPAHLPQAPNLHYAGQQAYGDLPRILKGSDICLMPFAQNDATRYISPTKTLEYMATHRPIVSTPITDVARFYSDIVYLAAGAEAFATQIGAALAESAEVRAHKARREEKILAEQGWDAIVDNMETLMQIEWNKLKPASAPRATVRTTAQRKGTPTSQTENGVSRKRGGALKSTDL